MLPATSHEELEYLVHGSHVEYDAQLGHTHGDEAPQENGGAEALAKGNRLWGDSAPAVKPPDFLFPSLHGSSGAKTVTVGL